jgi:hypothetical protein
MLREADPVRRFLCQARCKNACAIANARQRVGSITLVVTSIGMVA